MAQATAGLAGDDKRAVSHGLLYIDIDQLNVVNENHGMHVGDEVILGVASLLCRRGRQGTLVARMAGDRFIMFLPGCGIEPAARIAEELRAAAVNMSGVRGDKPLLVSLSIGVSRIGEREPRLEHAVAAAEIACRTAKERGRNRVEVFYGGDKGAAGNRGGAGIVAQITAALGTDSFELLAQPLLPLLAVPADPPRQAGGCRRKPGDHAQGRPLGDRADAGSAGRLPRYATAAPGEILLDPGGRFARRRRILAAARTDGARLEYRTGHVDPGVARRGRQRPDQPHPPLHGPAACASPCTISAAACIRCPT